VTLTPELLAELRRKAEAARLSGGKSVSFSEVATLYDAAPPTVVLALLDRIAEQATAIDGALAEVRRGDARIADLGQRWRANSYLHSGRVVNHDIPRDCITLKEPDPCAMCSAVETPK